MTTIRRWLWAALGLVLAGCGGAPPPAPPTVVNATVVTAANTNGAAPVALRIYQLASPTGFDGAQFFQLFDKDAATLKADLVKRDDLLMAPGTSRTLALMPEDRVHAVGIFAAYRDYEHATWHAVVAVPAHQTSVLTVQADNAGVTAAIAPPRPAK